MYLFIYNKLFYQLLCVSIMLQTMLLKIEHFSYQGF